MVNLLSIWSFCGLIFLFYHCFRCSDTDELKNSSIFDLGTRLQSAIGLPSAELLDLNKMFEK